jgi:hypothetical protein
MYCLACMQIFTDHKKWTIDTKVPIVHQVSVSGVLHARSAGCQICSLLSDQLEAYQKFFRRATEKSRSSLYTVCDVEANADEVELVPGHDKETDPYDDRVTASELSFAFRFRWTNAMRWTHAMRSSWKMWRYWDELPPPVEYALIAEKSTD